MKICFVTDSVYTLGGIQRVLSVIASALSELHDVEILCNSKDGSNNKEVYNISPNVKVSIQEQLKEIDLITSIYAKICRNINKKTGLFNKESSVEFLASSYYPKKIQKNFIKYLSSKNYDIIIGVGGQYSLLLGIISDELKTKTMGWQHNSYEAYLRNPYRYHWREDALFNEYIPKLNEYIVLTDYDKEMFLKENNIKCTVMSNPTSFKSDEHCDLTSKMFLSAGRFNHQKGFDLLVESFSIYAKSESEWKLTIVGEGEDKERIQGMINNYNLDDRIIIKPFTDNIKKYFLESSVLLLSSRWEGMPMIVLESLVMGVPIISYNISASTQIIENGKEGILVDKYDINKFAEAMFALAKSTDDRRDMGRECILKAKEYAIENIINQWYMLINKV